MQDYDTTQIKVKVLMTFDPVQVSHQNQKQDAIVADESGSIKVTLWNEDVHILQTNKCYLLQKLQICSFQTEKFLCSANNERIKSSIDSVK